MAGLFVGSSAVASEGERVEPDQVAYQRKTVISFGEVRLSGTIVGPAGSYVSSRRRTRFDCLIRIRGNFRPELEASVDAL